MELLSEFDLIRNYFEGLSSHSHEFDSVNQAELNKIVQLGIGDDCALIDPPDGMSLCISMDTMVEAVHFPLNAPAEKVGYRVLAAALSDLAAMGAEPSHFTLSLTIPKADKVWLAAFSNGLQSLMKQFNLSLVGGDTTKGPLTIGVQVHGFLPKKTALLRSQAKNGDIVAVTGTLGDAGAALDLFDRKELTSDECYFMARDYHPSPRIKQGIELRSFANACIDISDGLLADAAHLAEKSSVLLELDLDKLPISKALLSLQGGQSVNLAASAGDDYELLFTLTEDKWCELLRQSDAALYTEIGRVKSGAGVVALRDGKAITELTQGYRHFG